MLFTLILSTLLLLTTSVKTSSAEEPSSKVIISKAGLKRIDDQYKKIEQALQEAKKNLEVSQTNSATVLSDIKELSTLEDEHKDLQKKYLRYLQDAGKEIQANDKAIADIEKYEKKVMSTSKTPIGGPQKKLLDDAQQERLDRLRWKSDATNNLDRANTLLSQLKISLQEMESRKGPLQEELRAWNKKQHEYETLISELRKQRIEMEEVYGKRKLASETSEAN